MAWVNIERNNNVYTYQLDLSKLVNHGDACVIGGRYVDNSHSFSYLYGKWGFDVESPELELRGNYWTINRDYYSDRLLVLEDLSVQNGSSVMMSFHFNKWGNSTEWMDADNNQGDLYVPTFILNDNGIIRIIKDKTTLQDFLSGYPFGGLKT